MKNKLIGLADMIGENIMSGNFMYFHRPVCSLFFERIGSNISPLYQNMRSGGAVPVNTGVPSKSL